MLFDTLKKVASNVSTTAETMAKRNSQAGKLFGATFEQVDYSDADGMIEKMLGIKMTKKAKIIGSTLAAGYVVGSGLLQENHKGRAGEVYAEGLANTISHQTSPGVRETSEMMEEDPRSQEKFIKENLSRTQAGVDPEIVFALHQLRGGD